MCPLKLAKSVIHIHSFCCVHFASIWLSDFQKWYLSVQFCTYYEIGTYGEVYSAVDRSTGKRVAVKILESITDNLEEIEEEYLVLRDLSQHPNLPTFVGIFLRKGVCFEDDQLWFVMEVSIVSLKHWNATVIKFSCTNFVRWASHNWELCHLFRFSYALGVQSPI